MTAHAYGQGSTFVPPGFVLEVQNRDASTVVSHRGGMPWNCAPIPGRLHRCRVQSVAWVGLRRVDRCACGAVRVNGSRWRERSSRVLAAKRRRHLSVVRG